MRFFRATLVNYLRLLWIAIVLVFELLPFRQSASQCQWPTPNSKRPSYDSRHVLIVADPQIPDRHSYPNSFRLFSWLTEVFVDLNLRKSWRMVAMKMNPDAVIFLGDMMDSGRIEMEYDEWYWSYVRFKKIFKMKGSLERHYVPGNHDIGLGTSRTHGLNRKAYAWYKNYFGSANTYADIGGHTFVFLDAPSLVNEDRERVTRKQPIRKWKGGEGFDFIRGFSRPSNPVVLITHIPLWRSDRADCGPLREKGTIRAGAGLGYQNTFGKEVSELILENIRPTVIFSGDDHDYCEFNHSVTIGANHDMMIKEVTVKSFSMIMNVKNPGFHLLTLTADPESTLDKMCLLPDQLRIYLSGFLPCAIISIVVLVYHHWRLSTSSGEKKLSRTSIPKPILSRQGRERGPLWMPVFRDARDVAYAPVALFFALMVWYLTN